MARNRRYWPPVGQVLVVLCIIAFMTAILFPVFQKVHEGRSGPYCPSNMKQVMLALTQYVQDNDNVLPAGVNSAGNGWAGEVYPFIKSAAAYHCPNDTSQAPFISYAENRNLVKQHLVNFTDPAATVALYETTTLNCDPAQLETISTTGIEAPQNSTRHESPQSPHGLYFAALDSHVKYLVPSQVSGGPQAVSVKQMPGGIYQETFALK